MPKAYEYKLLPTEECDQALSNVLEHKDHSFCLLPTFEPERHETSAREQHVFRTRLAAAPTPSPSGQPETYLTHSVLSGDTLHALSIQYGVTVADLKRINGLYTDNELFAHRIIRVPVPCDSLLLGSLPATVVESEGVKSGCASPRSVDSACRCADGGCECSGRCSGRQLLRKVDREVMAVADRWTDGVETDGALSAPPPDHATDARGGSWCAGDDCGLQWYCLFALALLLLFFVPVFFIVAEHESGQLGHHSHEHRLDLDVNS